jgi:uncharacterized repeat protein (TIGR03803 family)
MREINWVTKACSIFLFWAVTAVALPAQAPPVHAPLPTFTLLQRFNNTNGGDPLGALIQGADGSFYGTTMSGGVNTNSACAGYTNTGYCGTVFKVTPTGRLTSLYSFCRQANCTDGYIPSGSLVQGTDGNFYGTTLGGGAHGVCTVGTCGGTIFKITLSGAFTTLYSFSSGSGGYSPVGPLVQGPDGSFYGTTYDGGTGANCCGTIFKITPEGALTTLYAFSPPKGSYPDSGLTLGSDGNFYGVTQEGSGGDGTIFRVTPGGIVRLLHTFNGTDGSFPNRLVLGENSVFYGMTTSGGTGDNGTIFEVTPDGTLTTLYNFFWDTYLGPMGPLVQGNDGNFYGTTIYGGEDNSGQIFEMTPSGAFTMLYSIPRPPAFLPGALLQSTNGTFYGTTSAGGGVRLCGEGGEISCGTVFSFGTGLGAFVATQPAMGAAGTSITILGTDLTGTTSVTFNGTLAAFQVKSKSWITATVPAGATTGTVQVVTSGGTLSSNVPFTVD